MKRRKACFSAQERLYPCGMSKKKRRHRLGGQSSQNVALGRRELIVRTLAQEPHAHLRLNAAGVEKMSEVLLGFAEPILDRLAPLDEKKAMLFFAITAWNYCLISSKETRAHALGVTAHFQQRPQPGRLRDAHPAQKRNFTRATGGYSWISK